MLYELYCAPIFKGAGETMGTLSTLYLKGLLLIVAGIH